MTESPSDQPLVAPPKALPFPLGPKIGVAAVLIFVAAAGALRFGSGDLAMPARDDVSNAEIAKRAARVNALEPLKLDEVSAADRDLATTAMALPTEDQRKLAADIAASRVRLVWMSFYDSDAEDGDVITVSSGGLTQTIRLTKQPVRVALPAPSDGFVRVLGAVDGAGGGVTVGIVTPMGPTPLAVLSVGQTIVVPVKSE